MCRLDFIRKKARKKLQYLQEGAIKAGIEKVLLKQLNYICEYKNYEFSKRNTNGILIRSLILAILIIFISVSMVNYLLSTRCLLPSNYLVWEATRPLADCRYCDNVTKPIILRNVSREQFNEYAYSPKPIIVKNGISNWKAIKEFNFGMLKRLYEQTHGSYESFDEGCQFLNFKTNLFSLKEVFNMPEARVRNEPGQKPWYIGWGNCHPEILLTLRQYYNVPDFLPEDAEFPATENIFFGFEMGAVMHLDYIPRLMWQGQVSGRKTWLLAPVPECDHVCQKFQFYVEPGDVVLLDTRIWYHATKIPKDEFSLTVQSEYG